MSDNAREIIRPQGEGRDADHRMMKRVQPRLGVLDLLLQVWRSRLLIFLIFFSFVLAGLGVAQLFPAQAVANARVMVSAPQEIAMTRFGEQAARITIRPALAPLERETRMARAPAYAAAAIAKLGVERVFPEPAMLVGAETGRTPDELEARFLAALEVTREPQSSILKLRYRHSNGATAVDALDAYVEAYLARGSMEGGSALRQRPGTTEERSVEERLAQADNALLAFLDDNQVGDLSAEIASVNASLTTILQSLVAVRASLSETSGRVQELEALIAETPTEIELFVEQVTTDRTAALMSEREQMRARFGSDHPIVEDLDRQIALARQAPPQRLEAGRTRTGLNPAHQSLAADLSKARADLAALRDRAAELSRQREQTDNRRRELAGLEPEWRRLLRTRDALEREAAAGKGRERPSGDVETSARLELLEPASLEGAVLAPERAIPAMFAGLGLLAGLAVGLIRGLLVKGLPTPVAVERTLGLRVLAAVGER